MAKFDYVTPKDIIKGINKKKKEGYFVQRLNDKKILAQYYEIVLKDKKKAEALYEEIKQDLKNLLLKSPKGTSRDIANFLRNLQNKETGSFVEHPAIFWLEMERAKHILFLLKENNLKPKYPLKFLNKVDTGERLKEYFKSLLFDFSKNNEDELNLVITRLPTIKSYGFHKFGEEWDDVYFECIEMWQDPKTGYWGPWIKKGNKINKKPELSITFHIIRIYYDKKTHQPINKNRKPRYAKKIVETTWNLKNKNFPYGWLEKRNWSTHHNYDVATILSIFDKDSSKTKKLFIRFLSWCLNKNLQKNGGFIGLKPNLKEPTIYSTHFAILLLRELGYFSTRNYDYLRSNEDFPINSYRIYQSKVHDNFFDTTNLKYVIYTKKTTPDPIDTRNRIFRFWSKNKQQDPVQASNTNSILEFEKYPPKKFKIKTLKKLPKLEKNQILVPVDRYGRKCNL